MKKILYISHVDWNWIKQRPHFLAEGLMERYDVSVLYMFQNRNRKKLQKRTIKGKIHPVFVIPMASRMKPVGWINDLFLFVQTLFHIKKIDPDCLYLTYPLQAAAVPASFDGTVIYDCMDDHIAMCHKAGKSVMQKKETKIVHRADHILVSSENLGKVLASRYGENCWSKISLVRNGYTGNILTIKEKSIGKGDAFTISYIGTVGKWFNFDFVLKSLDDFSNLRYRIIGPCDVNPPQHERVEYMGTIEHHKLFDAVKDTDCLVMPFVLNDIVASVDPVKLYEYINYNMNILCVRYPEIERFEPFVHFYRDYEEYRDEIKSMMQDNTIKYSDEARREFLMENNWEHRVERIVSLLQR